jgi:hypothetical protein
VRVCLEPANRKRFRPVAGNRTDRVTLPLTRPSVAMMVVVPGDKAVATPLVLMVATLGLLLLQIRPLVPPRLLSEPS